MIEEEVWQVIEDFPNYEVSNQGRIYNLRLRRMMSTSINNHGYVKITLAANRGDRHDRSVALLVAQAFVEPPNILCDHVVILDGDLTNVDARNLVWRPRWFAWKYRHQLNKAQPLHYKNLHVANTTTGDVYSSIIKCCHTEGLLYDEVWKSTYMSKPVFPFSHIYEIVERV